MDQKFLQKKFSVGLCLNEPFSCIESFLQRYQPWLKSVYFSLPLGARYYSRESLAQEYDGNDVKLFEVISMLKRFQIHSEITINTWDLTEEEQENAIIYCRQHDIVPDEVVCLREYGSRFAQAFPDAEIKYSANNLEADGHRITRDFHTLIAGKGLLRDVTRRHAFLQQGWNVTLLLNNGCISTCNTECNTIQCHRYFDSMIGRKGLDYTFAYCSFFPSELWTLLKCDPYAKEYCFKISNRPLGIQYTQQVLDAYLHMEDNLEEMGHDFKKMARFCTVRPLAVKLEQVHLERVMEYKDQWKMEMLHGIDW